MKNWTDNTVIVVDMSQYIEKVRIPTPFKATLLEWPYGDGEGNGSEFMIRTSDGEELELYSSQILEMMSPEEIVHYCKGNEYGSFRLK